MASYFNYTIKEFLIESYDGLTSIDATSTIASVQYFEDLFSPSIFITMLLVNTDGLLSSLPSKDRSISQGIRGGERVRLIIEQPATKQELKLDETKNTYYIYKVHASSTESTREVFVVELAPVEVFINETSRVFRRYPETEGSEQTIDISVDKILTDVLKTTKPKNIEKTFNKYSFFGNSKKPFNVLTWLCPKSIPIIGSSSPTAGTAGFLFYENKSGYNFKSVDTLMSGLSPQSATPTSVPNYFYTETVNNPASVDSNFKVLKMPVFEKNVNIIENLRVGMYSSINYFYDINTRKFNSYNYKLTDSYNIMKHTSTKNEVPKIPTGLENSPSRLMVKTIDNLINTPLNAASPTTNLDRKAQYQAQSVARYNLAFSQLLNITIPLNLNLKVGDVIQLNFGTITKSDSTKGTRDQRKSGLYLIKELSHLFAQNQGYTGLKVIRDSYGN